METEVLEIRRASSRVWGQRILRIDPGTGDQTLLATQEVVAAVPGPKTLGPTRFPESMTTRLKTLAVG
ncbi:MAG: hypothetical protein Ct9H300mP12_05510 [Acidimicrobiales bacterium]|nr:MAG: hypothetical protein Ct9H300mP12_05510 [Acidimicrobiales bacterium]